MIIIGKNITKENIIGISDFYFLDGKRRVDIKTKEYEFWLEDYNFYDTIIEPEYAFNQFHIQILRWIEEKNNGIKNSN